jgi:3-hydroxyisobutyrate dehydrogenase
MADCNHAIACECVALAYKFGLELNVMALAINQSSGWSLAFEQAMRALARGGQTATMSLGRRVEELKRACEMAFGCGAPMLIANAVRAIFETCANDRGAEADTDELIHLFERAAGIKFPVG